MANIFQPLWVNNVGTTLAAGLTSAATTCTLTNASGIPIAVNSPPPGASGSWGGFTFVYGLAMTLISATNNSVFEIVGITNITGNVATIRRAQDGTTALAFNAGDLANLLITAGGLLNLAPTNGNPGVAFFASPGNNTGQVITYDQFKTTISSINTGYTISPNGLIDQTVTATVPLLNNAFFSQLVTLPIAYPHTSFDAVCSFWGDQPPPGVSISCKPATNTQVEVTTCGMPGQTSSGLGIVVRCRGN